MAKSQLLLFCVECRPSGGGKADTSTFFLPALNADEAILVAMSSVKDTRARGYDVADPFEDHADLEVRVGSFGPGDPPEIEFGDCSPFRQ